MSYYLNSVKCSSLLHWAKRWGNSSHLVYKEIHRLKPIIYELLIWPKALLGTFFPCSLIGHFSHGYEQIPGKKQIEEENIYLG